MYVRVLIVVLIVLNAGVALWWATQAAAPRAPAPSAAAEGVPLDVVQAPVDTVPGDMPAVPSRAAGELAATTSGIAQPASTGGETAVAAPPESAETTVAPPAVVAEAAPAPTLTTCVSLGPFASRDDAQVALARVRPLILRSRLREVAGREASSFRVILPGAGNREAAQALVQRIATAGFDDYFLLAQGEQNYAVALGRYRSRDAAERRRAALVAAGFPAQLVAGDEAVAPRWWIDLSTRVPVATLQGRLGAVGRQSLDCAALR